MRAGLVSSVGFYSICGLATLFYCSQRIAEAAPARFWISPSVTDPLMPGAASVGAVSGGTRFLNIWGQPATELYIPNEPIDPPFDPVTNPFRTLQNFTFDLVLTEDSASVVDFLDPFIKVYNPVITDPVSMMSTKRFEYVNDSSNVAPRDPLTSKFSEADVAAGARDAINRLQGFTISVDPQYTGIGGGECTEGDPYCTVIDDNAPAWLLATVAWRAVGNGNGEVSLQIGATGINHEGESADSIRLTFGSTSEPVYRGDQRNQTLENDLPDVMAPTVETATTLQWQGASGDWASNNWGSSSPSLWPSWTEDAILGPGLDLQTITVSANQEANSTIVNSGVLRVLPGATLSSDVEVGPEGGISGGGSLSGSLLLGGEFLIDSPQPLRIAGQADVTCATLAVGIDYLAQIAVDEEFQILEAGGGVIGSIGAMTGDDVGGGYKISSIRQTATGVYVKIAAAGDYNFDGVVDAADYTVWRDAEGQPAGTLPNDIDGGVIGPEQYATWVAAYGTVFGVPITAVPEPSAVASILLTLLAVSALRSLGSVNRKRVVERSHTAKASTNRDTGILRLFGPIRQAASPHTDRPLNVIALRLLRVGFPFLLCATPSLAQLTEQSKFIPADAVDFDYFAVSVGLSGTTAVGHSPNDSDQGTSSGSLYVFDARTGLQLDKLVPSDAATNDGVATGGLSPYTIAIDGSTIVVGAVGDDDSGPDSGSAYLFNSTTGAQLHKLQPTDGAAGLEFGHSVDISGNRAIVGVSPEFLGANDSPGAAYVFDTTTGSQLLRLSPTDPEENVTGNGFGWDVAIGSDTAVVSALSGRIYFFDLATGDEISSFFAGFSQSVAIDGNRVIASAFAGLPYGFIFEIADGQVQLHQLLFPSDASDEWGRSVDISGDFAVVGDNDILGTGYATVYDTNTGEEVARLQASDGAIADSFGYSVAISDTKVVVGSEQPFSNVEGAEDNPGSAYIFSLSNSWNASGSGLWSDPANWSEGAAPTQSVRVVLGDAATAPTTVTLDVDASIAELRFDNPTNSYTITPTGMSQLTLTGAAKINTISGSHTINAPIAGIDGLDKRGPGDLTLGGANTYSGPTRVREGRLTFSTGSGMGSTNRITIDAGATLDISGLGNYTTTGGQVITGGDGDTPGVLQVGTLTVTSSSELMGDLDITGNVVNNGRYTPGLSPEIVNIDGDFDQGPTGVLEIEVGGLVDGDEYDQIRVTGTATLGGRIDLPLIDPDGPDGPAGVFIPSVGQEITAIDATAVVGEFDLITSPNLGALTSTVAIDIFPDTATGDVKVMFVEPSNAIDFVRTTAGPLNWADGDNWTMMQTPDSTNIIELDGSAVQRLVVAEDPMIMGSANAFAHQITVTGSSTEKITLEVESNLSATVGIDVEQNGVVELDGGTVAVSSLRVEDGGLVSGNGTVLGDFVLGDGSGEGMLSPGFSIGSVTVTGNYTQTTGGVLEIEVEGFNPNEADSIIINGEADLGGEIVIDASGLTSADVGKTVEILTTTLGLKDGTLFERETTINNTDIYIDITYTEDSASATVRSPGDMNGDGVITVEDIGPFALALSDPDGYFDTYKRVPDTAGNLDNNDRLDFDDIPVFASLLDVPSSTVTAAVLAAMTDPVLPEPSSGWLAVIAAVSSATRCRASRVHNRRG